MSIWDDVMSCDDRVGKATSGTNATTAWTKRCRRLWWWCWRWRSGQRWRHATRRYAKHIVLLMMVMLLLLLLMMAIWLARQIAVCRCVFIGLRSGVGGCGCGSIGRRCCRQWRNATGAVWQPQRRCSIVAVIAIILTGTILSRKRILLMVLLRLVVMMEVVVMLLVWLLMVQLLFAMVVMQLIGHRAAQTCAGMVNWVFGSGVRITVVSHTGHILNWIMGQPLIALRRTGAVHVSIQFRCGTKSSCKLKSHVDINWLIPYSGQKELFRIYICQEQLGFSDSLS